MMDFGTISALYMAQLAKKTLYDDLLFSCVCRYGDSVEDLLRPVLGKPGLEVTAVLPQAHMPNLVGHSGRMDVTAVDRADGTLYDIELQQCPTEAMETRVRLYSAFLDMEAFKRGREGYKTARNTMVVVYCGFDPWKDEPPEMVGGQPMRPETYPVSRSFERSGRRFRDGSRIVFFNGASERDTPCGRLARDLRCTEGARMHNRRLGARFDFLKRNPKGVEIMEMQLDEMCQRIFADGSNKRALSNAANFLAMGLSPADVAKGVELPLAVVEGLKAESAKGQPPLQ